MPLSPVHVRIVHAMAGLAALAGVACSSRADVAVPDDGLAPLSTAAPTADTGTVASTPTTPEPTLAPVCTLTDALRSCPHRTVTLSPTAVVRRDVHVQLPNGTPPASGWPVAVLFQGSFFSAALFWEARPNDPFGAWYQTGTVASLLDAGFAVLAPEALAGGNTFWNTNVPPYSIAWETSPDHDLMLALFDAIDDGTFGPVDPDRLYASGISSGGYMTSRMALSYPGRFRALAIHSASWATCSGPLCVLPRTLPFDHPPTLFLHGEGDNVVPIATMESYADQLEAEGFDVRVVRDADAGHEWIPAAPEQITRLFLSFP